jgi:hypothetical protein
VRILDIAHSDLPEAFIHTNTRTVLLLAYLRDHVRLAVWTAGVFRESEQT